MNAEKKYASRGLEGARWATATLHGGGQAAHPEISRCLYRGGQPGGATSRRRPLARIIHDSSSRNRAVASRDGHAEP
jgi:hypothetical protein